MKKNIDLPLLQKERIYWKTVEESCLNEREFLLYKKRKKAVDMYIDGYSIKEIKNETGLLGKSEAKRLLNKCISTDENGNYYGYIALIPYKRIANNYNRIKPIQSSELNSNYSGMFEKLLYDYPELKKYIEDLYFGKIKTVLEKNITGYFIHNKFLEKCKILGVKEHEYPFNTKNKGKRTLYKYISNLAINNSLSIHKRLDSNAIEKLTSTGIGKQMTLPDVRPFSVVQLDGHKIDCIVTIEVPTPNSDKETKTIQRFWLLTLIDVATRTILGYHITIESAYNHFDVLKCLKNAIIPKTIMDFKINGLEYPTNSGFHSIAIPESAWAIFDEIMLDNAMAHLSKDVINKITNYLLSTINFGPVATPERRGIIERFFETLETRGFHRVVSTTGTGITDPRRRKAEKDAIKYVVTFQELLELTEILIAQYNNTPHSAINGFSPLEVMKQRLNRGLLPNYLEIEKRSNFMLDYITVTRKIRGKLGTGRRPYITFEGAEYRSDVLSKSFDLVGHTLTLRLNPDDIRTCKTFFEDGSEFCDLYVVGKWQNCPHSLAQRKAANALLNEKKLKGNSFIDPVEKLEEHLINKSQNSKRARNKLASLQQTIRSDNNNKTNITNTSTYSEVKVKMLSTEELEKRFKNENNKIRLT